jgi:transposase-like protein
MLSAGLQAEVATYIDAHVGEVDEADRRLVVRNGYRGEREVTTAAGAVAVRVPRVMTSGSMRPPVSDRSGSPRAILPVRARKSPQVTEALPLL